MLGLPEEEQYRLLWEKYGLSEEKARALKGKGFSYYDLDKGSMYAYVAQKPLEDVLELRRENPWMKVELLLDITPQLLHDRDLLRKAECAEKWWGIKADLVYRKFMEGYPIHYIRMAYIISQHSSMTVEENLMLASGGGRWLSISRKAERNALKERVASLGLGLEDRMKAPVGLLSGGQRQAVSLLMATINPPKLLLLDEHTAALDPAAAEKILDVTEKTVSENGLTCLMITHNMASALKLGTRTVMMMDGQIIFDASGDERASLTVDDLLVRFKDAAGKMLDNDRMLLS